MMTSYAASFPSFSPPVFAPYRNRAGAPFYFQSSFNSAYYEMTNPWVRRKRKLAEQLKCIGVGVGIGFVVRLGFVAAAATLTTPLAIPVAILAASALSSIFTAAVTSRIRGTKLQRGWWKKAFRRGLIAGAIGGMIGVAASGFVLSHIPSTSLTPPAYAGISLQHLTMRNAGTLSFSHFQNAHHAIRVSSGFGMRYHPILGINRMHDGIDIAAPIGTPIHSTTDGIVKTAGWVRGYGNAVYITQGNAEMVYGHMSRIAPYVHKGMHVARGEILGRVGSTGLSTGPHLHYGLAERGQWINPDRIYGTPRLKRLLFA